MTFGIVDEPNRTRAVSDETHASARLISLEVTFLLVPGLGFHKAVALTLHAPSTSRLGTAC